MFYFNWDEVKYRYGRKYLNMVYLLFLNRWVYFFFILLFYWLNVVYLLKLFHWGVSPGDISTYLRWCSFRNRHSPLWKSLPVSKNIIPLQKTSFSYLENSFGLLRTPITFQEYIGSEGSRASIVCSLVSSWAQGAFFNLKSF